MKKATFWKSKDGSGYAPLSPEFVNWDAPSGNVTKLSEALGEDYVDEKLLVSSYEKLDKTMADSGLEQRLTTNLLKFYEPEIVELTDEEYDLWRQNCEEA
ncbi:hypothetical protein QMA56_05050 [Leuconostoc falkenbergense]|uniref:hypothetical protein n=1 Tax=Leuconostoc falkenbergense TaxID=2766470 RepID=UPI0024AD5837|nr:hypothetical protein [Leuconostoc falkenbergense]MDI6667076.1 hypothetical protein [Leuconostoc falkenbergense]